MPSRTPGILGTGQFVAKPVDLPDSTATIPGAEWYGQRFQEGATSAGQRQAPGMTAAVVGPAVQLDASQQAQFRGQQTDLAAALAAQANGQGPSLAQGQLRQATDRSLQQALALQSSQRGAGTSSALKNIAGQQASISQQAAGDSANLRLNEQMQARNALGQVLAGARGQDMAFAGQNADLASQNQLAQAGYNQQAGLANQQASLQQQQLNDNLTQYYLSQGMNLAQAQQQAQMQLAQLRVQQNTAMEGINAGGFEGAAGRWQQLMKGVATGLGSATGLYVEPSGGG